MTEYLLSLDLRKCLQGTVCVYLVAQRINKEILCYIMVGAVLVKKCRERDVTTYVSVFFYGTFVLTRLTFLIEIFTINTFRPHGVYILRGLSSHQSGAL
jgi:hypothetical protein